MSESRYPAKSRAGCPRPAPDIFVIHLLGGSGAEVLVEARLRPEWVEVWFAGRPRAVLGRQALKTWLDAPLDTLLVEDVVWTVSGTGQITLALADVGVWPVPIHVLDGLRARL
jgi:hypothetical protein